MSGYVSPLASDVEKVVEAAARIGLQLNPSKCEIVAQDFKIISTCKIFADFKQVQREGMTLRVAPIFKEPAVQWNKIDELDKAKSKLTILHSHDALTLFEKSMSLPELLYTLHTSEYSVTPLL